MIDDDNPISGMHQIDNTIIFDPNPLSKLAPESRCCEGNELYVNDFDGSYNPRDLLWSMHANLVLPNSSIEFHKNPSSFNPFLISSNVIVG